MAKTLDQYLAETGRQSTLDELGRQGQLDQARADFASGKGQFATNQLSSTSSYTPGSYNFSAPSFDFSSAVKEAIKMNQEAARPAVESLQASIPEVQQKFATTKQQIESSIEPLKQRYQNLLEDIKGQSKVREEAQTRVTSGELAKRGIVGSSTLAQQEIQNAVDPIRSATQTATKEVGLTQEEALNNLSNLIANLSGQETEATRAIRNAIAQLQAGAGQTGITQALQQGQFSQSQAQAAAQLAESQRQFEEQQAQASKIYETISLPESQATIANMSKTSAVGNPLAYLNPNYLGLTTTSYEPTGFANVDKLLAQGRFNEARQLLLNP